MPVPDVREQLREGFTQWGLPGLLRIDNGHPWGSQGDLPTDLALWLLGLGIDLWWNAPCHPEENGVVERSQGTGKRWGEPSTCVNGLELQARLDDLDHLQRCLYPYKGHQSRMAWHAGLGAGGRSYERGTEPLVWDWQRVAQHLGNYCGARQVDQKGQISIYNRNHYVGVRHRQQKVWLMFDSEACQWVIANAQGQILKQTEASELRAERILALEVTNRR